MPYSVVTAQQVCSTEMVKTIFIQLLYLQTLAMHSLAAESRPRLSETEPKWFVFENAFSGRYCIKSVASQK